MMTSPETPATAASAFDRSVPHPARTYDYLLGGRDNFAADRDSAETMAAVFPTIRTAARENRRFMHRTAAYLARAGIQQFLDVGTGIPTSPNLHEIVQGITPEARIAYVDHDPYVMVHARALLTSDPRGRLAYLHADLRQPGTILDHPDLARVLDLTQPVGLSLLAVLHFLGPQDHPDRHVARLVAALAPGSYVAISHATADHFPAGKVDRVRTVARDAGMTLRPREEVEELFDGLDLIPPGLVSVTDWHPDEPRNRKRPSAAEVSLHGALGRVP